MHERRLLRGAAYVMAMSFAMFSPTASAAKTVLDGSWWLGADAAAKRAAVQTFVDYYAAGFEIGYAAGKQNTIGLLVSRDPSDATKKLAGELLAARDARAPKFSKPASEYVAMLDRYYRANRSARPQEFEFPMLQCMADEPLETCALAAQNHASKIPASAVTPPPASPSP